MDNTAARMDLGNKLKELRNKKGLTQEELADRCERVLSVSWKMT